MHGAENVTFTASPNAKFTNVKIGYHSGQDTGLPAKTSSTLTAKGFNVTGKLLVYAADQKVVIEENTAGQITVKTFVIMDMDIQVLKNQITGGETPQKYGVYIVPNMTDYDLTVKGNTFTGIKKHAICVQGVSDGIARTAAKSVTVAENTFTSYGLDKENGRAAFKIWADTMLEPNRTDPINKAAKTLAESIKANNVFADSLGANCVVANFYDQNVAFN